ncbi:KpsF/GutQ family sugar-phosphate isomerase [Orrella daihaiensis]|uniref:KpsF/GutQ family sugar-phosphate isomerase n=1 Tax=Orrella daihaiensis TaxID=2782176 RepID=A0ABY4ANQ5_9BURK|nr:KpsF/GutQ family sugar-phosphate isomerase [Orrella daihaiensis]UOD50662.1 KpsF/GutQ family sugar-phosphate isomerase [Orrella daihaiensis]
MSETNQLAAEILASGEQTLATEAQALHDLKQRLDETFVQAVGMLLACRGRVIVCGLGKTGHIARKIAATLASTGTPAMFMHAAEALHGDLGMLTAQDMLLALSHSGSGDELLTVVAAAHRLNVPVVALTGNPKSDLAQLSRVHLDVSVTNEACPMNLAPTASTTVALAMGDALAVACLNARGFTPEDFARSHPAGALGRRLLTRVRDVMRQGQAIPQVGPSASITQALDEMSRKGMGMTAVVNEQGIAIGIFTDGDLRRLIESAGDIRGLNVTNGMSHHPQHISPEMLAVDAASTMDERRISQILVADDAGKLIGALHMHDLMTAKVL